jgi:DnaJ family protein C protein 9
MFLGSDEERNDLKRIYLEVVGDMDQIFERHLLTCLEDEDRLRSMIDQMIEDKEVPPFDAYTKETKAKRNKRHKKVDENFSCRSNFDVYF